MTDWKPPEIPPWDGKTDLSVVVPFCDEGSNVIFTTQALIEELDGFCKYEIILVDNMSHDHLVCKAGDREYPVYSRNFFFHPPKGTTAEQCPDQSKWSKIDTLFFRRQIVRYFTYDVKQGHWNAKNHGIMQSKGKYLYFVDAHTIQKRDSLRKMLQFLRDNDGKTFSHPMTPDKPDVWRVGAVHQFINYILDSRCLQYGVERKTFGYKFRTNEMESYWVDETGTEVVPTDEIRKVTRVAMNPPSEKHGETWMQKYGHDPVVGRYLTANGINVPPAWPKRKIRFPTKPYPVPVMSTCGMMCPRETFHDTGMWNPELGIYAGGESYCVWKQSTCGWLHYIHPEAQCWHHADHRGYSWNHSDYVRNSMIARYVIGGDEFLKEETQARLHKDNPNVLRALEEDVRTKCKGDRDFVASKQVIDIDSYLSWWEQNGPVWH